MLQNFLSFEKSYEDLRFCLFSFPFNTIIIYVGRSEKDPIVLLWLYSFYENKSALAFNAASSNGVLLITLYILYSIYRLLYILYLKERELELRWSIYMPAVLQEYIQWTFSRCFWNECDLFVFISWIHHSCERWIESCFLVTHISISTRSEANLFQLPFSFLIRSQKVNLEKLCDNSQILHKKTQFYKNSELSGYK